MEEGKGDQGTHGCPEGTRWELPPTRPPRSTSAKTPLPWLLGTEAAGCTPLLPLRLDACWRHGPLGPDTLGAGPCSTWLFLSPTSGPSPERIA